MNRISATICGALGLAALLVTSTAQAGPIDCAECGWSISVDGKEMATGSISVDKNGNIHIEGDPAVSGDGYSAQVNNFGGHVDPEIVFGLGATNTSGTVKTFAFAFDVALGGISVPIDTMAQLGTTLTAPSDGDAMVFPTLGVGKIVDSQDIRYNPFESKDKGVDIGDAFSVDAGMTDVRVESLTGSILSGGPFDLMAVTVAFGLSGNGTAGTGVGFSGSVKQVLVPEPTSACLLAIGLGGLAWQGRRRAA